MVFSPSETCFCCDVESNFVLFSSPQIDSTVCSHTDILFFILTRIFLGSNTCFFLAPLYHHARPQVLNDVIYFLGDTYEIYVSPFDFVKIFFIIIIRWAVSNTDHLIFLLKLPLLLFIIIYYLFFLF